MSLFSGAPLMVGFTGNHATLFLEIVPRTDATGPTPSLLSAVREQ
jgi:hypothetical protein